MVAHLRLLAFVLAAPLLAFAAVTHTSAGLDEELRSEISQRQPRPTAAQIQGMTMTRFCEAEAAIAAGIPACQKAVWLERIRKASLVLVVLGLGLLAMIAYAAFASQSDRNVLLSLFRPGLYLTAVMTTGLIIAHGALIIGTFVVIGVRGGGLLLVGLGALAGAAAVIRSSFAVVKTIETFAVGAGVQPAETPAVWNTTTAIATRLGSLQPDNIVLGLDPTFYVTEATVATRETTLTGRTLFCSLPLMRILTIDEFRAIVAHELGHFRGEDTKFSTRFYPIYRGASNAIIGLHNVGEGWARIPVLPAIAIFGFFLERFATAERRHGRERELLADRAGAEATSAQIMATALVKVHAFAGLWDMANVAARKLPDYAIFNANVSAVFAEMSARRSSPKALEGIANTHTAHPTDSHPPLSVRLASLGVSLQSTEMDALRVRPSEAASGLVPDHEERELSLSAQQRSMQQVGNLFENWESNPG